MFSRAAFVFCVLCVASPLGAAQQKPTKADRSDAFFADRAIRVFHIELAEPALTMLRQRPRAFVHGKVSEGANSFADVGIHLKGMGSFRIVDEKPSFVLKFDQFAPDQ